MTTIQSQTRQKEFRQLMTKGLDLYHIVNNENKKSVIYIDVGATVLFCGKVKNSSTADYYMFYEFTGAEPIGETNLVLTFGERYLVLSFSSSNVRDFMMISFTNLFTN
jgi:hypothetical protein